MHSEACLPGGNRYSCFRIDSEKYETFVIVSQGCYVIQCSPIAYLHCTVVHVYVTVSHLPMR